MQTLHMLNDLGLPIGLPVLGWTIPDGVARALNLEFGTRFAGRSRDEIELVVVVDRARQLRAITPGSATALLASSLVTWRDGAAW